MTPAARRHRRKSRQGTAAPQVEVERTRRQIQHLSEISKLLTDLRSVEVTAPQVIAAMARVLPVRGAGLIVEAGGTPRTIAWQAQGESARRLPAAVARARAAYRYLVQSPSGGPRRTTLDLPPVAARRAGIRDSFVVLPLVVERGATFGALCLENTAPIDELDLVFIDAVVNQLAVALDRHFADRALRQSEAKLAGIVSIAADAIISVDEAQRIVMYNEGAEKIFGWSRAEVLGRPLDILLPERFRRIHDRHIRGFAAEGKTARPMGERRPAIFGLRKDGREFPAQAAISKLAVGGAWLFTVILRDITEQKRVEHEQRFLAELGAVLTNTLDVQEILSRVARLVARDLGDLCLVDLIDEQNQLRWVEGASSDPDKVGIVEALERLPAGRAEPLPGRGILRSKQARLVAEVSPAALRAVTPSEEHLRLLEAAGPTSLMEVPLLVQDRPLGALTVLSCRRERRYRNSDVSLLEEVGRRAGVALEKALLHREVARAVQLRDDLLGVVAHDLRNPLHAILLHAASLRPRGATPERRSQRPADAIERAARRMTRLIQDLLDVTCMEAGGLALQLAAIPAHRVVREAVEAQAPLAFSASLELRAEVAADVCEVCIDRDRLLQVFENLIGNAIKFTEPPGTIVVGAAPREDQVLFWVADTGTGIAQEDLPHVFERFWQARRTRPSGAGLGLPIAKGIVEAHGGRIWVESTPGRGSTFLFTVPRSPSGEERPVVPQGGEAGGGGPARHDQAELP